MTRQLRSSGVHYTATNHGIAILDTRRGRGRWRILDQVGAQLWLKITSGVPEESAVEELVGHWSRRGIDGSRVRTDLTAVRDELARARLLVPAERTPGPLDPPQIRFATAEPGPLGTRVAAQAGLAIALTLLRCTPLRFTIASARAAARLPGRPATVAQAEAIHAAVRRAARAWPGRAACLEESLASFLAAALSGHRVRWVLGASLWPQGAHAWIETDGAVVGQAPEDRVWPYVPVLRVERSN